MDTMVSEMKWFDIKDQIPPRNIEVLVWVDGHRGPSWKNSHAVVAYLDDKGRWIEERHQNEVIGVIKWAAFQDPT